tara:strand:+ start:466 stop:1380 length:915 start_codon:yes stop_codon:yes gene_type:complete
VSFESPDVVIPAYNGAKIISSSISSVLDILPDSNIIVVDDFSQDETFDHVSRNHPEVQLVKNDSNIGFGQTCNAGISHTNSEWVLILNQDACLLSLDIKEISNILSDPDVDIVGGKILDNSQHLQLNIGKRPKLPRLFLHWPFLPIRYAGIDVANLYDNDSSKYTKSHSVPWISGACLLIRRESFIQSNGFDSRYFLYVEELEYANRIGKSGGKIFFEPSMVASHSDRSGGPITSKAVFHTLRGQRIFVSSEFGALSSIPFMISASISCILWGLVSFIPLSLVGRYRSSIGLFSGGLKALFLGW